MQKQPCEAIFNQETFQNLAPIYEELADAFSHAKDKVVIAKVDADGEGKPLGKTHGVTGFPSTYQYLDQHFIIARYQPVDFPALKWFDAQGNAEKYDAARDLETLAN